MKTFRNNQGLTEQEFLAQYNMGDYPRPSVTVDPVIFTTVNGETDDPKKAPPKKLQVLLVKRSNHPDIYQWAIPGGFVGMSESPEQAAYRELEEETNVGREQVYLEQLYTWGEPNRDPRGRIVSISYLAMADAGKVNVRAGSDAKDARWFTVNLVPSTQNKSFTDNGFILEEFWKLTLVNEDLFESEEYPTLEANIKITKVVEGHVTRIKREVVEKRGIAFDHAVIIEYSLFRLRSKIDWTDIAFALMPPLFSLGELQRVYEAILGKELTDPNFRLKIKNRVIETKQKEQNVSYRPSRLYRYNPNWIINVSL